MQCSNCFMNFLFHAVFMDGAEECDLFLVEVVHDGIFCGLHDDLQESLTCNHFELDILA